MDKRGQSYWLEVAPIYGKKEQPSDGEILIIGAGLAGVSVAYWLQQEGFSDLTLVDYEPEKSASFRNCGHVLYGTVESPKALVALHGYETAREIWGLSIAICHEVRETLQRLQVEADYRQDGYLVIAIEPSEDEEVRESVAFLQDMGFRSSYVEASEIAQWGFRHCYGGRFEEGSAQAHPVKFRNAVLAAALGNGLAYHTGIEVRAVEEEGGRVQVRTRAGLLHYEAVVIAANAYSPLLSSYYARHRLVEPFRGQILTSRPFKHHRFPVTIPHSFDHGYEYALVTGDNRLMIGGWRNKTAGGEIGSFDITPNPAVEAGLTEFVKRHYVLAEEPEWEYSWAGIMASSRTGFPFIGPTSSSRIFTCAGFTGHGLSWAHGSAKLLAQVMAGKPVPAAMRHFNPVHL